MGVVRLLVVLRRWDRNMHGDGNKMISKTFRKPRRVPLMPEGDDDELGNHLIKKWCTGASECVWFSKTDWCKLRPLFQPYMYNHSTPIWEGALLITLVGTSIEPALLVAGVTRSLSIRGRAW